MRRRRSPRRDRDRDDEQGGRISVQILNEFAAPARRKLKRPRPDVAEALAAFRVLRPEPLLIGVTTHEAALGIAQRDGIGFYDSLIVASAIGASCSTLLSGDMQYERTIGGRVTIRDPEAQPESRLYREPQTKLFT